MAVIQVQARDLKPYDLSTHEEVISIMVYGASAQYTDVVCKSRATNRRFTIEGMSNEVWTIETRQTGETQ